MNKTFLHHSPGPDGFARTEKLRKAYSDLHTLVTELAPPSRERSIALTDLETSGMWATKAVILNDPESVALIPTGEDV